MAAGDDALAPYFAGRALYGDDFDAERIAAWYADEAEGYAGLGAADRGAYKYVYHAWNRHHVYRHLGEARLDDTLGFGSAYADELLPVIDRVKRLTVVDASSAFVSDRVHGVPATYVKPAVDGRLPFRDASFDFITCFGVLHHIPNVSFVAGELARVLRPGGILAVREPVISMGDWRHPRRGLTKRERGIPLDLFRALVSRAGLAIERESLCAFPLIPRLFRPLFDDPYNRAFATVLDAAAARAFAWNLRYHAVSPWQKLRPTAAFLIARRPRVA